MNHKQIKISGWLAGCSIVIALGGCGGGGGSSGGGTTPTPVITPLPAEVTIQDPTSPDVAQAVDFRASIASASDLTWKWDFGDGSTSDAATPSHRYARVGDYTVQVLVTNGKAEQRTARLLVSVNNKTHVQGLNCSRPNQGGWCWMGGQPLDIDIVGPVIARNGALWGMTTQPGWARSTDGGRTWSASAKYPEQVDALPAGSLRLFASDATTAWVQNTSNGGLWRTTDGGRTWSARSQLPTSSPSGSWSDISVLSSQILRVDGFQSSDGGATWSPSASPVFDAGFSSFTYSPWFMASPDGVIWQQGVSDKCRAQLCRSTDGGATYTAVPVDAIAGLRNLRLNLGRNGELMIEGSDRFQPVPGSTTGAYTARPFFLRSTDNGLHWQYLPGDGLPNQGCPGFSCSGFMMPPVLLIAGNGVVWTQVGGRLYLSTDGGATWSVRESPALLSRTTMGDGLIEASTPDNITITDGVWLWTSTDRGLHWTKGAQLSNVNLPWLRLGAAIGPKGLTAFEGSLQVRSDDAGRTWTQRQLTLDGAVRGVSFPSTDHGWIYDDRSVWLMPAEATQLPTRLWTAPQSWPTNDPDNAGSASISTMRFHSDTSGYLTVSPGSGTVTEVYTSSDGGRSWQVRGRVPLTDAKDLLALDDQRLLLTGQSCPRGNALACKPTIFQSTDAGRTWQVVWQRPDASPMHRPLRLIVQKETGVIWTVGEGQMVARSTDAGKTWTTVTLPGTSADTAYLTLNDIGFADAKFGWIVGTGGQIYATRDGGQTWTSQRMTGDLYALVIADPKTAWILGDRGVILSTGTGGN